MRVWIGNGCISMCADSLASAQDSSNAKALAFNKDVRTRCITLEGDDFNPSGHTDRRAYCFAGALYLN